MPPMKLHNILSALQFVEEGGRLQKGPKESLRSTTFPTWRPPWGPCGEFSRQSRDAELIPEVPQRLLGEPGNHQGIPDGEHKSKRDEAGQKHGQKHDDNDLDFLEG